MAAIHADLSTTPTGNPTSTPPDTTSTTAAAPPPGEPVAGLAGAMVIGRLTATGTRLAGLFGPPQITAPLGEGGLGWVIQTPGGTAGVRAWRHRTRLRTDTRHDPHTLTRWQIIADRAGPLPWLCKTITGSTTGLANLAAAAPVHAQPGGGGVRLLDLAWAYADYLYLHGQAIRAWLANTNRLARAHRSRRHLPLQLTLQLQPLVQVLHRHQAATATAAQRAAWAAMPCPLQDTGRHHDQADDQGGLRHWRASTRWLHQPDHPHAPHDPTSGPDQQVADPDPVDLAGMLRALADRHARYRPQVLTINPALDMTAYDEYQATLHALATTTSLNDHRSATRGPAANPT